MQFFRNDEHAERANIIHSKLLLLGQVASSRLFPQVGGPLLPEAHLTESISLDTRYEASRLKLNFTSFVSQFYRYLEATALLITEQSSTLANGALSPYVVLIEMVEFRY